MVTKLSPKDISKLGLPPLVMVNGELSYVQYCEILEEGLLNSDMKKDIPFLLQQKNLMNE